MQKFLTDLPHYWKTVLVVLGGISVVGTQVVDTVITNSADGSFGTSDWISTALLAATAVSVFLKKNAPKQDEADDVVEVVDAGW